MKHSFLLLALALAFALAGCGHKPAGDSAGADDKKDAGPPPTVWVATVKLGTAELALPTTGTLMAVPNSEAVIAAPVAGVLDQFSARVGQQVAKGEVIAHINTRTLMGQIDQARATIGQSELQVRQAQVGALQQRAQSRAAILQARASVSNARATLAGAQATLTGFQAALRNAEQNLERQKALLASGLVAKKDVEAAELAVEGARSQVDAQKQTIDAQRDTVAGQVHALQAAETAVMQDEIKRQDIGIARQQVANARGQLSTAQAQLALYTMRAPLSGRVVAVGANLGETVDTTVKLVTIANLSRLQLQLSVPSASGNVVRPGQSVSFRVDSHPGKVFTTTITNVSTQVDPTTGTLMAYAPVPNPNAELRDDQVAKVRIVTSRHVGALLVPRQALLVDAATGKKSIAVIGADSVLHVKPVTVGIESGDDVEITSGVKSGDQVAIQGQYGVADGTTVDVDKAGQPEKNDIDKAKGETPSAP